MAPDAGAARVKVDTAPGLKEKREEEKKSKKNRVSRAAHRAGGRTLSKQGLGGGMAKSFPAIGDRVLSRRLRVEIAR